ADAPAGGVQDLNGGGTSVSGARQLAPRVGPVAMQVESSAHEHDPAIDLVCRSTHSTDVFVFDVVRKGDGCFARVWGPFSTNLQLPVQHDPLGGEFNVGSICKAELTVNGHTTQRRRVDVEHHFLACVNGDLVACDGYLAVGPGGRIRPLRRL